MSRQHFPWNTDHEALRNLLNAEFNPDWDEDASDWQDIADGFVKWNRDHARQALASLDELLLVASDDATAQEVLDEVQFVGFIPDKMGPSVHAWLVHLRGELAAQLGGEASL